LRNRAASAMDRMPNRSSPSSLPDIVGVGQQIRVTVGVRQDFILHHKFDIGDTTPTLLEIEDLGGAGVQFGAHPLAHVADFLAQRVGIALALKTSRRMA
jgi:hypothetical protein